MLTEEADRKKLPQTQLSVGQKVKRFLSLQLKQAAFSMNVRIWNWKRETSFPLFYTIFSPVYTNSLMYKMVFFNVQFSMYNTINIVFFPTVSAKNFKEALVSLYLPNHGILISFIYSSILLQAKSLSDSVGTQRM